MLIGQVDLESIDIVHQVGDFTTSNNLKAEYLSKNLGQQIYSTCTHGENVWLLLQDICESNGSDGLSANFGTDFLKSGRDLLFLFRLLIVAHHASKSLSLLLSLFNLFLGLELSASEDVPRCERHTLVTSEI